MLRILRNESIISSKEKTMYYLKKVIFTSIVIGFGCFSELLLFAFEYYENAIIYFPILGILTLYYVYLIWKKRDISFEDILLLPLLKKLGLFYKTTEAISVRKKLFYNVGGLLVSMVVVFLIILVLPSPNEEEISIGNILLLLPIIGWIIFFVKEFGVKWINKSTEQTDCVNIQRVNVFSSVSEVVSEKWVIKEQRLFSSEEVKAVLDAVVVSGKLGRVVQFTLEGGYMAYIPLEQSSTLTVGDKVDMKHAKVLTLCKSGEKDIYRILA